MKRKILGFILSILLLFLVGCQETATNNIEAEVLSINSHILNGQLLGAFLGSSSGSFTNDVIKIGVKFEIGKYLFLEDLKLQHAELAYYKNKSTIPLCIQCTNGFPSSCNCIKIYLNGLCKKVVRLSIPVAEDIKNIISLE